MRANAEAALLEGRAFSAPLLDRLVALAGAHGVEQPYPHPDGRRDLGRRKFGARQAEALPCFQPDSRWIAARIVAAGAAVVSRLETRLGAAAPAERRTWLHALGHAGPEGVAALRRSPRTHADPQERFEVALIRVHAGGREADLVGVFLPLLGTANFEEPVIGGGTAWWRNQLAVRALVELGSVAVPALVRAMAAVRASEQGILPQEFSDAADVLRAIGKPALPAVEQAAADAQTGHLFRNLLERLRGR